MRGSTIAIAMALLANGAAWAQEGADPHPTAVSFVGGLSVGSSRLVGPGGLFAFDDSDAGLAVGGGIAHDLSPRLTLEATGLYLDRASSAWSADAGLRINLLPSQSSTVPYFAVSGGVYSERVDTGRWVEELARRGSRVFPPGDAGRHLFGLMDTVGRHWPDGADDWRTNGMLTFGGGVRFATGEHVFVRPDVRAQVLFDDDTRVLGLFTLNFGYRF
jgi:hypothetical protein